jgi:threonine dehydrogenase-like Zn-dependent dehydrogenase
MNMAESVRAAVLVAPGRYEVQSSAGQLPIEMLKRGGMILEMGNFADTGEISLNVHRHICSKNIRLIGLTNHPSTGYGPALRLLKRYADRYPFEEMVTHEFGLDDVETAMRTSMSHDSMKVVMVPGRGRVA